MPGSALSGLYRLAHLILITFEVVLIIILILQLNLPHFTLLTSWLPPPENLQLLLVSKYLIAHIFQGHKTDLFLSQFRL